ncbi:hypothetical protein MAC_08719 [Metarhizium acridum CQMa 102]|uniref:Uncharacterized protein n=1 Tax=Metarhizium acridum (strain CQMa 102) TaxID=655827 RepID=E9EFS1_METAQ|nr:uncharacterized protein MAC_08719 [Metarhizium acridum CQMa 102]EFY85259.1 hypothetical protein MAC_08719 [Metarhizium acridum CQMa 102]
MPSFLDPVHFNQAMSNQAMPVLQAIASNEHLRHLRRFERDDPPPYVSSTESSDHEADFMVPPRCRQIPEELQAVMERPIDDYEAKLIASSLRQHLRPYDFYYAEAKFEESRFEENIPKGPLPPEFRTLNFSRRKGVVVRHNVKRRWEKLGVWNPDWGFAGRQMQPRDKYQDWKWWWEPAMAVNDLGSGNDYEYELAARAVRLRQNLARGEYAPVVPRSHPGHHTTAAEAEAFLISRPWFIFQLEMAEEAHRYMRLSNEGHGRYSYSVQDQVIKWWKERGDWRDEFNKSNCVTAWKWRHESPSPEPEDLAPLNPMKENPLDVAAEMEFTPSEIDELETINLPRSDQPQGFWVAKMHDYTRYNFPGMMADVQAEAAQVEKERQAYRARMRAEGQEPRLHPAAEFFLKKHGALHMLGRPPPAENEEVSELQEHAASPPSRTRGLRPRQPRDQVHESQEQGESLPPLPRRSARIAAKKRPAESSPIQTVPNKRSKVAVAPKPATPVTQSSSRETRNSKARPGPGRPPVKGKTETGVKRGPGRPRKKKGSNIRSAVQTKPQRTTAPARPKKSRDTETDTSNVARKRGRPRKNR